MSVWAYLDVEPDGKSHRMRGTYAQFRRRSKQEFAAFDAELNMCAQSAVIASARRLPRFEVTEGAI